MLEDIEINYDDVDSLSNKHAFFDKTMSLEKLNEKKIEWMKNFVENNGFDVLVKIFETHLTKFLEFYNKTTEPSIMQKKSIEYLFKITKIFFNSSLTKYISPTSLKSDQPLRQGSSSIVSSSELTHLFEGKLSEKILNNFNYQDLSSNILDLLVILMLKKERTEEENRIIRISYEFLILMAGFSPKMTFVEKMLTITKFESFIKITKIGILNDSTHLRAIISTSLIRLIKICEKTI